MWPDHESDWFGLSVHGAVVQFGVVRAVWLKTIPQRCSPALLLVAWRQVHDVLLNGKIIESNNDVGVVGIVAQTDEAADRKPAVAASTLDLSQLNARGCDAKLTLDGVQRETSRPQQAKVAHDAQQLVRWYRRALGQLHGEIENDTIVSVG